MNTTNQQPQELGAVGSSAVLGERRYRVHDWINTNTMQPVYGIQCKKERGKWVNCAVDGTALLYTKRETAETHCRWLNDPQGTAPEWSQDSAL